MFGIHRLDDDFLDSEFLQVVGDKDALPDDVAEVGLARLPFGPVHNWGQKEGDPGQMGQSVAARRQRIVAIAAAMGTPVEPTQEVAGGDCR